MSIDAYPIHELNDKSVGFFHENGFLLLRDTCTDTQIQNAVQAIWNKIPEQMDKPITLRNSGGHRKREPRFVYRVGFHNGVGDLTTDLISLPANVLKFMTHDQHRLAGYKKATLS